MVRSRVGPDGLLDKGSCALVIIDVQERLMPVIAEGSRVIDNVVKLARFACIMGLPVVLSEQAKLGPTVAEIRAELLGLEPITKIHFDCLGCDGLRERISQLGKRTLILAGVETHICVAQTALHAVADYTVHVVSDATSSRNPENRSVALERMRWSGVTVTTTEMFMYELLREAGTTQFKATLPLVK